MKASLFLAAAAVLLAACSSGTTIRVSDEDARIYVNGEYLGDGRVHYSDKRLAFSVQEVSVRKDGCADLDYTIRRNEKPAVGAIISAYYLALPVLWVSKYKDHHDYEYICERTDGEIVQEFTEPVDGNG